MQKFLLILTTVFTGIVFWVISIANSGSQHPLMAMLNYVPFGDKVAHFVLYGSFALLLIVASKLRFTQIGPCRIYTAALWVTCFVTIEESSHLFIDTRSFEIPDMIMNMLGIVTACLCARTVSEKLIKKSSTP